MTTTDYVTVPVHYSVTPDSSFVEFVGYNKDLRQAYIVIHDVTYTYSDVGYGDYTNLVNAESVGHEYSKWFRSTFGPGDVEYGMVYFEQATDSVEAGVWDQLLLGEDEMNALVTEVARETAKDVETMNAIDPIAEATWQRREALEYAIRIHAGTAQDDSIVLDTAEAFREYLNG